jgi:hypothetical protein
MSAQAVTCSILIRTSSMPGTLLRRPNSSIGLLFVLQRRGRLGKSP